MRRIYEDAAYETPQNCWWRDSTPPADLPMLNGDITADIAIIGGGFTGLNAARSAAQSGASVVVIDAQQPGWGASGRNGGFCCLGGAKLTGAAIARMFGNAERASWHKAERAAVDHVQDLLARENITADTHSQGETLLAHTPKAMTDIRAYASEAKATYGVEPYVFEQTEMRQMGLQGAFYGGVTLPIGFALNPAMYHAGLLKSAMDAGVQCHGQSPATAITKEGTGWRVKTPGASITASKVILATNGYSSEDVPDWLRARYLPVQSSIIVTRPITKDEQAQQGWTSLQMCYDTRTLLHYFRLTPGGRFLFGMRGGRTATPGSEAGLKRKIRRDFGQLFPEWQHIDIDYDWSGLVCLTSRLTPFAGPVPDMPGVFAAFGYHGNGVAMGSYLGTQVGKLATTGTTTDPFPEFLQREPKRFPLGRFRRALLAPTYAAASLLDR